MKRNRWHFSYFFIVATCLNSITIGNLPLNLRFKLKFLSDVTDVAIQLRKECWNFTLEEFSSGKWRKTCYFKIPTSTICLEWYQKLSDFRISILQQFLSEWGTWNNKQVSEIRKGKLCFWNMLRLCQIAPNPGVD